MAKFVQKYLIIYLFVSYFGCERSYSPLDYAKYYYLNVPSNIYPSDNSSEITINTILKWRCNNAKSYTVLLDSIPESSTIIAKNIYSDSLLLNKLNFNTKYYWKVIIHFASGDSLESDIWNFKTKKVLPLTISNIELDFPKADLRVDWYWHWNDFYGSSQRRDTLRNIYRFSFNPANLRNFKINYNSESDHLEFSIFKSTHAGYEYNTDSLNSYIKLDTINTVADLRLNFYIKDDNIRSTTDYDKQLTESMIKMLGIPYIIDNQGYLLIHLNSANADNYVNDFDYDFYRSQWDYAAFGGESLNLLDFFGFEINKVIHIKLYF